MSNITIESKDKKMKKEKKKKKSEKKDRKEKKTHMEKKRKRSHSNQCNNDGQDDHSQTSCIQTSKKKHKKEKVTTNGTKMESTNPMNPLSNDSSITSTTLPSSSSSSSYFPFDYKYILAPMVGASELAFRILCRKYGAQLAYTPMMSASAFVADAQYRQENFQTIPEDRPLVCHFCANHPQDFAQAAKIVEPYCDAIDLNLGCPQRTAFVGHFGSYLLDPVDRTLVLDIVRTARQAVSVPIFCKIRLLDTLQDTIQLCQQLRDAGASLIAVHARYRASYEREGPGARDGPALLDQVLEIKKVLKDFPIITNGNTRTYDDVVANLHYTQADGAMSAEGILDNPALFLPRYCDKTESNLNGRKQNTDTFIRIMTPSPLSQGSSMCVQDDKSQSQTPVDDKKKRKLLKKLHAIQVMEEKMDKKELNQDQIHKLSSKAAIEKELAILQQAHEKTTTHEETAKTPQPPKTQIVSLQSLLESSQDKIQLAKEYIALVQKYPVKLRSVIFHIRRMCKDMLNRFQLMEECVGSNSLEDVIKVLNKLTRYREDPATFQFDIEKERREKEALDRKRREEGKRKEYEARMVRKAKREKKEDIEFYLRQGSKVPTKQEITRLRKLSRDEQLLQWKANDHAQHCISYHLDEGGCKRDRSCCFLHVDAQGETTFVEANEVAG